MRVSPAPFWVKGASHPLLCNPPTHTKRFLGLMGMVVTHRPIFGATQGKSWV